MRTRARCLLVWVGVSAVTASTAWWALGAVAPATRFDELVTSMAGLVLAACAVWAWLVCTVVVTQALRTPARVPRRPGGVPSWAQHAVLAACGVTLLTTAAAQASYDVHDLPGRAPAPTLDGLPFPDRAQGPAHAEPAAPLRRSAAARTVVVEPGDSLWRIAGSLLPPGASDTEVAAATAALVDLNRGVVGDDPDLIHPGLRLRTPGS